MKCNICGGNKFDYPHFRDRSLGTYQGHENTPIRCVQCQSLERHRIMKDIYDVFGNKEADKILLFSNDPAKNYLPEHLEISLYEEKNSIDLLNINRSDRTYDMILCHHIIEHINDDEKAFQELCRILKPKGQLFWSVPSPTILSKTIYTNKDIDPLGHHRYYGEDFLNIVETWSLKYNVKTQNILWKDNVTKFTDIIFLTEKID